MTSCAKKFQAVVLTLLISLTSILTAAQTRVPNYNGRLLEYGIQRPPHDTFGTGWRREFPVSRPDKFDRELLDLSRLRRGGVPSSSYVLELPDWSNLLGCELDVAPKYNDSALTRLTGKLKVKN